MQSTNDFLKFFDSICDCYDITNFVVKSTIVSSEQYLRSQSQAKLFLHFSFKFPISKMGLGSNSCNAGIQTNMLSRDLQTLEREYRSRNNRTKRNFITRKNEVVERQLPKSRLKIFEKQGEKITVNKISNFSQFNCIDSTSTK